VVWLHEGDSERQEDYTPFNQLFLWFMRGEKRSNAWRNLNTALLLLAYWADEVCFPSMIKCVRYVLIFMDQPGELASYDGLVARHYNVNVSDITDE
jgi:hypothetical protein